MATGKRYYWLKLNHDFFKDKKIKKLRRIAGGDTYTIIYLKLMLLVLHSDGIYEYDGIEGTLAEEIALELDEEVDNVEVTLNFLRNAKLLEEVSADRYMLPQAIECMGSEAASAQRVREYRAKQKSDVPRLEAKTNAERQLSFRAKKVCEENGHVPFIEDYANKKRYNGNYYICFKRDKCRCAICGSNENLCLHHIDGFNENKPENSAKNKMVTLCRNCHSKIHAGATIPTAILESIGYYDLCNESNETCNADVTRMKRNGNVEKEREKEKEIERDIEIEEEGTERSRTDYQKIVALYHSICKSYPEIKALSENRKKAIRARLKTYSIDDFETVFKKAEASDFMKGGNNRNWSATFDWMLKDANFAKIIEGNYDNKEQQYTQSQAQPQSGFNSNDYLLNIINGSEAQR